MITSFLKGISLVLKLLLSTLKFQCELKKKPLKMRKGNNLQSSGKLATFMRRH